MIALNHDLAAALEPVPEYKGTLERLKLEVDIACWNWERRRGLPHYDGGGFATARLFFGDPRKTKLAKP